MDLAWWLGDIQDQHQDDFCKAAQKSNLAEEYVYESFQ